LNRDEFFDLLQMTLETNIEDAIRLVRDFPHELRLNLMEMRRDLDISQDREIWGFYEEEYPIYTSRKDAHPDLGSPMLVEEANNLVKWIKEAKMPTVIKAPM
jgi:protein associated with RNAse G/E